jgi:hypothetical protein
MKLPQLPNDRAGRLGLAATGAVLWWTLALANIWILVVGLPLVVLGVRFARRYYPTPPEPDTFDDWF